MHGDAKWKLVEYLKMIIFGMEDEYRYFLIIEESKIIIYRDRGEEEKFLKFSLMENEYQHL